jgi:hypothetical protein
MQKKLSSENTKLKLTEKEVRYNFIHLSKKIEAC